MFGTRIKDDDLKDILKAIKRAQYKRNHAGQEARKYTGKVERDPSPNSVLLATKNLRMVQDNIETELADCLEAHVKKLRQRK